MAPTRYDDADPAAPKTVPETEPETILETAPKADSDADSDAVLEAASQANPASPNPIASNAPAVAAQSWWGKLWQRHQENIRVLAIALIIAVVVRLVVAEPRFIPSDSMEPTLHVGDRLIIEKLAYHLATPKRGDIVVFEPPIQLKTQGYRRSPAFIKRVIGKAGETVAVHDGRVYINGAPLDEPYILAPPGYELRPVQVPPEHLFVMGDNRNNSNDSHVWGFLPVQNVIGHALYRFWPLDNIAAL